jgi:uncharacterized radical SAM superfamily Fe-S cluster-containing enzyme
VTVVSFLEGFNFCLAGVKRSCIHFVIPDGRIIPFDTYNLRAPPVPRVQRYLRSVPLTTMSTCRIPHCEHTSLSRQSRTVMSAP